MSRLFQEAIKSDPVECLGQTFPNDEARRQHFLKLLAERLSDPTFRNQEGFPDGTDEAILAMSDPPYYTACPNPWVSEFVRLFGTTYDGSPYSKDPFASDVSEGKNDPVYNAHSYHTKVPHRAIMRYILHYTKPGDIVFDGFSGTGMTGVAAQQCDDVRTIRSLGYRVDQDANILAQVVENGEETWKVISQVGRRLTVLNDLSPFAAFVASRYNDFDPADYISNSLIDQILAQDASPREAYTTCGPKEDHRRPFDYVIWSEVFSCPSCQNESSLYEFAVTSANGELRSEFHCGSCGKLLKKENLNRVWVSTLDIDGRTVLREPKTVPVQIVAPADNGKTIRFAPARYDVALAASFDTRPLVNIPIAAFPNGRQTRKVRNGSGIERVHQMFTRRSLMFLSYAWGVMSNNEHSRAYRAALFLLSGTLALISKRERYRDGSGKGAQSGTLYVPSLQVEKSPFDVLGRKVKSFRNMPLSTSSMYSCISTGSHSSLRNVPDNCIDYIFTDPPFGESLQYAELNYFHEAWFRVWSAISSDCVLNYVHHKNLNFYQSLMRKSFAEAYRILKPGRWITVEFSNTQASVWNAIQVALQEAGFVVANVSALDKQQGSFNSVTTTTSVKQDLVISAYKPNGGLEDRFSQAGGTEESVWDFVYTHLKHLAVVKLKNGTMQFVVERDPRIIFDRMVAWFVRHSVAVPLSSPEFQEGLASRFAIRDGMVFLPEQAAEYDRKRSQHSQAPQMELFVSDERSAIDWLADFLKRRPSTYQELHPEFIAQLGAGWKKHERKPELSALLEANFLQYDGNADVPSQIHSYLSSNHKDLRGLEKSDPRLKSKACDRWYVPDPNKAQDLEKKREKALLKEFDIYLAATGRRLKEFRLEVLRAGFKAAWAKKDYQTITKVAQKIPEEVLQEDEKLLLWYDQALTRTEAGA